MARVLILSFFLWPLLAATAGDEARIVQLYGRGLAGDKAAVNDCITALEARLARAPEDQLARVYLGSSWTLRSRDLPIGRSKLSALRKGIALMDEAAAAAPDNAKVLLLRAVTNEALPGFLGRGREARQQLEALVALIEPNPERLSAADCQLLYLNAGQAAQRAGEPNRAKELWQRGLTIEADPAVKKQIERALTPE
jgi:hypothetical protein